jgi:hypothetical protein
MNKRFGEKTKVLWRDRKRWCGLPLSFTRYYLVQKEDGWLKLFSSIGFLSIVDEEINLYRVFDLSVVATLTNRMFGTGTIVLHCNVNNTQQMYLVRIKDPYKVRGMIAELIEKERAKRGLSLSEFTF